MTDPDPRIEAVAKAVYGICHYGGGETSFAEPVTLIECSRERVITAGGEVRTVEWDREKVVPIIADVPDVLRTFGSQREAEAIFDALDREQT